MLGLLTRGRGCDPVLLIRKGGLSEQPVPPKLLITQVVGLVLRVGELVNKGRGHVMSYPP